MLFWTYLLSVAALLCKPTTADWQYLSRPDLSPPRLNITVRAQSSVESGFVFVAPYLGFDEGSAGPEQPAAYIFRDNGDLVWSSVGYIAGWVADFSPTVVDGQPVLKAFQGILDASHGRMYGDHVLLNDHYETIKVVRSASHRLVSCHEFNVVDGKTVLIETPVSIPADLSPYGGDEDQKWIVSNGFQELDIHTGELLFSWYSLDHVPPKYSAFPLDKNSVFNARSSADAWNYFHINSVDKDDENHYLISARNYAALFKLNGTNGEVIWQLGGIHGSDFEIPENVRFAYQHDARFRYRSSDGQIERISLFDNADHSAPHHSINPFSRARYIELNHTAGTAREIWTYPAPDELVTHSQGNVQFLPNGNVFVNWGQAGAVTEFGEHGDVVFHAYLDSHPSKYVQSYRGFRSKWKGFSGEDPALLALKHDNGLVSFYVSWNGDTETSSWHFYLAGDEGEAIKNLSYLGSQERTSFETVYHAYLPHLDGDLGDLVIVAEARDSEGKFLGRSKATRVTSDAVYRSHVGFDSHAHGLRHGNDQHILEL